MKLKTTLRYTKGAELLTHLGAEYDDQARVGPGRATVPAGWPFLDPNGIRSPRW